MLKYKVLYFYECICICLDDAMYIDMRLHTYMVSMDVLHAYRNIR